MQYKNRLEKSLAIPRLPLNLSTLLYLIDEIILSTSQSSQVDNRLISIGAQVAPKILELLNHQNNKYMKRENKHLEMLRNVISKVWMFMFGRPADELEKTREQDNEYIIKDYQFPLVKYITQTNNYSPAAFFQGFLQEYLSSKLYNNYYWLGAGFECQVQYYVENMDDGRILTAFIIEFDKEVITRELQY